MEKKLKKNHPTLNPFAIFIFILLATYTLTLLVSLYWAVITSLKGRSDFRYNHLFQFPKEWIWENFKVVFDEMSLPVTVNGRTRQVEFSEMLWNSIWLPLTITTLSLLVRTTSAYVLAKYKFKGNEVIYAVVFFAMVIPISNTLPALLKVLRTLGIYEHPISVVMMNMHLLDTSFLVLYAGYKNLSWEYAEAAIVEGASHPRIMFQIMIPLMAPTISTYFLLGFVGLWNDFSINFQFLRTYPMISYGLFYYYTQPTQKFTVPLQLAASVLAMVPTLTLFMLFKNKFMGNLTLGGLKG